MMILDSGLLFGPPCINYCFFELQRAEFGSFWGQRVFLVSKSFINYNSDYLEPWMENLSIKGNQFRRKSYRSNSLKLNTIIQQINSMRQVI